MDPCGSPEVTLGGSRDKYIFLSAGRNAESRLLNIPSAHPVAAHIWIPHNRPQGALRAPSHEPLPISHQPAPSQGGSALIRDVFIFFVFTVCDKRIPLRAAEEG